GSKLGMFLIICFPSASKLSHHFWAASALSSSDSFFKYPPVVVCSGCSAFSSSVISTSGIHFTGDNGASLNSRYALLIRQSSKVQLESLSKNLIVCVSVQKQPEFPSVMLKSPLFQLPLLKSPLFQLPLLRSPLFQLPLLKSPLFRRPLLKSPLFR